MPASREKNCRIKSKKDCIHDLQLHLYGLPKPANMDRFRFNLGILDLKGFIPNPKILWK